MAVASLHPSEEHHREELERIYVWDTVVRVTHWLVALSIAVLTATGIYLGHPFLASPGAAHTHLSLIHISEPTRPY